MYRGKLLYGYSHDCTKKVVGGHLIKAQLRGVLINYKYKYVDNIFEPEIQRKKASVDKTIKKQNKAKI